MPQTNPEMPTRVLGRTGFETSIIGLGGWHLGFKWILHWDRRRLACKVSQ